MTEQSTQLERLRREVETSIDFDRLWEGEYKLMLKDQLEERLRSDARRQAMADVSDILNARKPKPNVSRIGDSQYE